MKLTISTLACPKWTLEQIIQHAAAAGIQGIDFRGIGEQLDITQLPAFTGQLDTTLAKLGQHNLQMPCLNMSVTLVTPDAGKWQQYLEETQRHAALASKTRTRFLRIFGGRAPQGMSREEARVLAQRHLRQIAKIAAAHGCLPILETHDDWARSDEVLELLHEFTPQEVGVLWDVEHPFRKSESPQATFDALNRFVRHVHFKDSVRAQGKNKPKLLGEGELPLAQFYSVLSRGGYDGWVCLETEKRWDVDAPEPEVSIPQFAEFMQSLAQRS